LATTDKLLQTAKLQNFFSFFFFFVFFPVVTAEWRNERENVKMAKTPVTIDAESV
jgi:hypothetical protein